MTLLELLKSRANIKLVAYLACFLLAGIGLIYFSPVPLAEYPEMSILLKSLGEGLFVSAIITITTKIFLDRETPKIIAKELENELKLESLKHNIESIPTSVSAILEKKLFLEKVHQTVLDIFSDRDESDFTNFFKKANKNIDILTTNLDTISQLDNEIKRKIKSNLDLKVRILALDPKHHFVKNRIESDGIYDSVDFFYRRLKDSIRKYTLIKDQFRGDKQEDNLQIKIFSSPPSVMIYRFDDNILVGFILSQGSSRTYTHILMSKNSSLSNCFIEHFEEVFKKAKDITTEEIDSNWSDNYDEA